MRLENEKKKKLQKEIVNKNKEEKLKEYKNREITKNDYDYKITAKNENTIKASIFMKEQFLLLKIKKKEVYKYFEIAENSLQQGVWDLLNRFEIGNKNRSKVLNKNQENLLKEIVIKKAMDHDAMGNCEIMEIVERMQKERFQENKKQYELIYKENIRVGPSPPSLEYIYKLGPRLNLKHIVGNKIEQERRDASKKSNIVNFHNKIFKDNKEIDWNKIDKAFVWNCDETMIGFDDNSHVVWVPEELDKAFYHLDQRNAEHVTALVGINAAGLMMPPYLIYPLVNCPDSLLDLVQDGFIFVGGQKSGWIDKNTFFAWIKEFVKINNINKKNKNYTGKTVLFVDGHNSRDNLEMIKFLIEKENDVEIIVFPSHTTQIFQPLDVGPFGPFKKYLPVIYKKYFKELMKEEKVIEMKSNTEKFRFILARSLVEALKQAGSIGNIVNSFRATGIYPISLPTLLKSKRIINDDVIPILLNVPIVSMEKIPQKFSILKIDGTFFDISSQQFQLIQMIISNLKFSNDQKLEFISKIIDLEKKDIDLEILNTNTIPEREKEIEKEKEKEKEIETPKKKKE